MLEKIIKTISKKRNLIFICIIILLAGFTRLWMLGKVPISMSDDEIREVYSAYSIFKTRSDIFGNFLPLVIKMEGFTFGPITIYLASLFFAFFDLTLFSGRLPYALAGILSIVTLFFIVKKLTKSGTVAFLSSVAMIFSAWHLQVSRVAHDAGIALLFYLIAINLFIRIKKNKIGLTIASSLLFAVAFYCYVATRVIFIPVILSLIWYKYRDITKKQLLIITFFVVTVISSFGILSVTNNAAQYVGGQFFFQNSAKTSLAVELERRASKSPNGLKEAYHNKYRYWFNIFTDRYLHIFSPQFLFLNGESNGINSLPDRGELYAIEAPLLAIGAFYLFLKKRREFVLIALFLLISPLPSAVGGMNITYVTRSVFLIPWLYFFVGYGLYSIYHFGKNKKITKTVYIFIGLLYIYLIMGYFTQYYYDWSHYGAKYFSKSTRDLVSYVNKEENGRKKIIIAAVSQNTFLHYAFYNKLDPEIVIKSLGKTPIAYKNLIFQENCLGGQLDNPRDFIENNSVYVSAMSCNTKVKENFKIKTYDNVETIWKIYIK
jgi:4-amino-4-deoxy-L-arabinose transferase-like glycosyltransferase